jgi:hypothetical protein
MLFSRRSLLKVLGGAVLAELLIPWKVYGEDILGGTPEILVAHSSVDAVAEAALRRGVDPRVRYPYYSLVPKGFQANVAFRRGLLSLAAENVELQAGLRAMCARDLLFYVNAFCWTFVPSTTWLLNNPMAKRPFITWPVQDEVLEEIESALGDHDLLLEKSRDMGASWLCLIPMEHQWHFQHMRRFGLLSRNESYVDDTENPKALFWKIDFLHAHQPAWLLPTGRWLGPKDPNRKALHLKNADTGSTIDGEATTGECFRGDRLDGVMLDEFASVEPIGDGFKAERATRDATPCRIYNSTPKGAGNAFHERTRSSTRRVRMYWADHPIKRRGLYRGEKGTLTIVDRGYWERRLIDEGIEYKPQDFVAACRSIYPFVIDDDEFTLRSPWFDAECARCTNRSEIRQELEIRYDAGSAPFFDHTDVQTHRKEYACRPLHAGELDYDGDSLKPDEFVDREGGRLLLWFRLGATGRPAPSQYVIGVDIAAGGRDFAGRGASNSVATVADKRTKEVVAEYAVAGMRPDVFADRVFTMGRWFRDEHGCEARMIWEANGPGTSFGDRIMELGYGDVYYRQTETARIKKRSAEPGWHSNSKTRPLLLGEYRRALQSREFIEHHEELFAECEQYEYAPNGQIIHKGAQTAEDPTGARENHGDRVISRACCWWEVRGAECVRETNPEIPPNCYEARRLERDRKDRQMESVQQRKERARRGV